MTLRESYGIHLLNIFRYSDFKDERANTIEAKLLGNHWGSETPLIPKPGSIECNRVDELKTEVTLRWEDYSMNFTFLWKKGKNGTNYFLEDIV